MFDLSVPALTGNQVLVAPGHKAMTVMTKSFSSFESAWENDDTILYSTSENQASIKTLAT
jgi:hypothetical protein